MPELVYILKLREHIRHPEDIFKVGRTTKPMSHRLAGYPKGAIVMKSFSCYHSIKAEKNLLEAFRDRFTPAIDYGSEYFRGNFHEMLKLMQDIVNQERRDMELFLSPPLFPTATNPLCKSLKSIGHPPLSQFIYKPD